MPNKRYSDFPLIDKHLENGELHKSTLNGPPAEGKEDVPELPAVNSPASNLRKSSGASSGSPAPKKAKISVDITNPVYLRPLKLGWKRELVYR